MVIQDDNAFQRMTDEDRSKRLYYVGFTPEDAAILADLQQFIGRHSHYIVDRFYENIERHNELVELIISTGSSIEKLKKSQRIYVETLFGGVYDLHYFNQRLKIGYIHNQIGLTPGWYLGGYSNYMQILTPLLFKRLWYRPRRYLRTMSALNKILFIDAQLAIETYISGLMEDIHAVSVSKDDLEQRVERYCEIIRLISSGDLTKRLEIDDSDSSLNQLGSEINRMIDSLSNMTGNIMAAAQQVNQVINKLKGSISMHSSGASQQASAVAETTSTLEEIKATSQQTQIKAQNLGSAAEQIRNEGENGSRAVEQVIAAMHTIRDRMNSIAQTILALNDKTQQISNIINVVSNLSQNSKMLALNASIEAAKAGEAGKGFAIVAAEVRDLAEQSEHSTSKIHKILHDIQIASDRAVMATEQGTNVVNHGESLVQQTGETIRQLSDVITNAVIASQQIVAAVRQEGAGISQVAVAMNQINQVTSQFVAASAETKQVAEELAALSSGLNDSIAIYNKS